MFLLVDLVPWQPLSPVELSYHYGNFIDVMQVMRNFKWICVNKDFNKIILCWAI